MGPDISDLYQSLESAITKCNDLPLNKRLELLKAIKTDISPEKVDLIAQNIVIKADGNKISFESKQKLTAISEKSVTVKSSDKKTKSDSLLSQAIEDVRSQSKNLQSRDSKDNVNSIKARNLTRILDAIESNTTSKVIMHILDKSGESKPTTLTSDKQSELPEEEAPVTIKIPSFLPEADTTLATKPKFKAKLLKSTVTTTRSESQSKAHKSGMEKFHRAAEHAKNIGRGIVEAEKRGHKPVKLEDYQSEAILHVRDDPRYAEWKESGTYTSFEVWLKEKESISPTEKPPEVSYLTPQERLDYKITFNTGKLQKNEQPEQPLNTKHTSHGVETNDFAFVIGPDETLYAAPHAPGTFHHSSFVAGGAVISAGMIETDATGKVLMLSNESGHYKPGLDQLLSSLSILKKNGVDLSSVRVEFKTPEAILIYNSGSDFLETKGLCEPDRYKAAGQGTDTALVTPEKDTTGNITKLTITHDTPVEFCTTIFNKLKKTNKFNESFKIVETGENTFEYNGNEFMQNNGISLPTAWKEGLIDREGDKITGLHINRIDSEKPQAQELVEYQINSLLHLKDKGLALDQIKIYDCNNVMLDQSADNYLDDLFNRS